MKKIVFIQWGENLNVNQRRFSSREGNTYLWNIQMIIYIKNIILFFRDLTCKFLRSWFSFLTIETRICRHQCTCFLQYKLKIKWKYQSFEQRNLDSEPMILIKFWFEKMMNFVTMTLQIHRFINIFTSVANKKCSQAALYLLSPW